MKSCIPWIISAVSVSASLALFLSSGSKGQVAQSATAPPPAVVEKPPVRTITVIGEGTAEAEPDIAEVRIRVTVNLPKFQQAWDNAQEKMVKLLQTVKSKGVEEKDVQTVDFYVWQETRPAGYSVSHDVKVTVRDLKEVGAIMDAASRTGVYVQGVTFGLAEPDAVKSKARDNAMADAERKAGRLASAVNGKKGEVRSISEVVRMMPVPDQGQGEGTIGLATLGMIGHGGAEETGESAVPVQFGQMTMSSRLSVVYSIQ